MGALDVIHDCQWGSTGKGLFCNYLARQRRPQVLAMAPSPNAGHTYIAPGDIQVVHRMLPTGIGQEGLEAIVLGPGSLLDLDALCEEILFARSIGQLDPKVPIYVHKAAAVVLDRHRDAEAGGNTAPGSTRKGTGAAQIERIRRRPSDCNIVGLLDIDHPVFNHLTLVDTADLQSIYLDALRVQIEGCQGYSLSVYHGQWPYVTCRDVTTASVLADVGMPMRHLSGMHVYGTFRTYPIRVANRPEDGEWSGPTYPDSIEISFEDLGMRQEYTTVTKLPRRLFTYSQQQAVEACVQNRIDYAFLNFCQYCPDWETLRDIWLRLEEAAVVSYMGFGPRHTDVVRVGAPNITESHVRDLYHDYRVAALHC